MPYAVWLMLSRPGVQFFPAQVLLVTCGRLLVTISARQCWGRKAMPGVLEGIRVIDFGQYIAGPLAAVMLGDQGADVIHVDPPGGPRWQHPSDAFCNRGKRRIILDLKTPDGVDAAKKLIAGADVVIENFRPGVMQRLGLGAEEMTAADQRLIYVSMPGFAA